MRTSKSYTKATAWIWDMQLQDVHTESGDRLSFERVVELPTLPQSELSYQAGTYFLNAGGSADVRRISVERHR